MFWHFFLNLQSSKYNKQLRKSNWNREEYLKNNGCTVGIYWNLKKVLVFTGRLFFLLTDIVVNVRVSSFGKKMPLSEQRPNMKEILFQENDAKYFWKVWKLKPSRMCSYLFSFPVWKCCRSCCFVDTVLFQPFSHSAPWKNCNQLKFHLCKNQNHGAQLLPQSACGISWTSSGGARSSLW